MIEKNQDKRRDIGKKIFMDSNFHKPRRLKLVEQHYYK